MSDAGTTAPRITVFMTPTCPHCRMTCELLTGRGAAFRSFDVSTDRDALMRLIWMTGQATVPAVVVGDDVLVGFDEARLLALIEIANSPIPPAEDAD